MRMDPEMIDNFIMHPDWSKMEDFIMSHFEHETDIDEIDVNKETSIVHAEVIARQRISTDIKSLKASFRGLRVQKEKTKTNYE